MDEETPSGRVNSFFVFGIWPAVVAILTVVVVVKRDRKLGRAMRVNDEMMMGMQMKRTKRSSKGCRLVSPSRSYCAASFDVQPPATSGAGARSLARAEATKELVNDACCWLNERPPV